MSRNENPPFERGFTYYNGGTIDPANLGGINLEGKEWLFEVNPEVDPASPGGGDPSGRQVLCRCVRNVSGITLKAARVGVFQKTDAPYQTRVDGYTFALADPPAGVIDEYLTGGVVNNDLFWLVVQGPTKVTQPHSGVGPFAVGDRLVPTAGGGSSKTDDLAGRVTKQDLTGATGTLGGNIQNVVAYASQAEAGTIDVTLKAIVALGTR